MDLMPDAVTPTLCCPAPHLDAFRPAAQNTSSLWPRSGFQSQLCHQPPVQPWACPSLSLNLPPPPRIGHDGSSSSSKVTEGEGARGARSVKGELMSG